MIQSPRGNITLVKALEREVCVLLGGPYIASISCLIFRNIKAFFKFLYYFKFTYNPTYIPKSPLLHPKIIYELTPLIHIPPLLYWCLVLQYLFAKGLFLEPCRICTKSTQKKKNGKRWSKKSNCYQISIF